jgi:NAD(P)-dependent dehydrogenase (short-subunit alcohol dehydrogenase family)
MGSEDRIAIITGAAGGIGQALSREFVRAGWKIGITDVNRAALEALAGTLDGNALAVAADVSDPASCVALVDRVRGHFGGLHAVVNNAALGMGAVREDHFTRQVQIEDVTTEMWQRFLAVNLSGPFFMAKAAIPDFRAQKFGRIVNVTTSFFTMLNGGWAPYAPSKAGVEAWSAGLSKELKGTGITVNVVVPGGPTDTPMVPKDSGYDRQSMIRPEQMAPPMLFLCSEEGGAVSGQRFIAANWNARLKPGEAAEQCGMPIGWPELARTTAVFPGGLPA